MSELNGKRVVITRPVHQAGQFADLLRKHGAVPVHFPTIEIMPVGDNPDIDYALQNLDSYDWVVFTSVNGVETVWKRMASLNILGLSPFSKVAAIGPKTARALTRRGVGIDLIPDEYIAEQIFAGLGDVAGKRVLLLRADIARRTLPELIREHGGLADDIAVYRTLPSEPDPIGLEIINAGVDVITFTSPSTLDNFSLLVGRADLDPVKLPGNPVFAYIGPVTADKARELGYPVELVARSYTIEGLTEALLRYFREREPAL